MSPDQPPTRDARADPLVAHDPTRSVLEGAHEAFISMDAGGFIIDWNPQAQATFG